MPKPTLNSAVSMPLSLDRVSLVPIAVFTFVAIYICGCASRSTPRLTASEQAILKFKVQGISIGSGAGDLRRFPQLQKIPGPPGGAEICQIFNPSQHISLLVAWFRDHRVEQIELRYINAPVVNTLAISGGWIGIRNYLVQKYGPPSEFGPRVPVVATVDGLDPNTAAFNGVWFFTRAYRQLNYIATVNPQGGLAVVSLRDTLPPKTVQKKTGATVAQDSTSIPPPAAEPNPGF